MSTGTAAAEDPAHSSSTSPTAPGRPRPRRPRALLLLLGAAALTVAVVAVLVVVLRSRGAAPRTTEPPLDRARLAPGPCTLAADVLVDSHRRVGDLQAGISDVATSAAALARDQDGLAPLIADPTSRPQAAALRTAIGYLSLAADAGTFAPSQVDDLVAAQRAVEARCVLPR